MSRWICTTACRAIGQNFKEGDIIDHGSNPASAYFGAYSGDKSLLPVNNVRRDLDGTYYFGASGWNDLKFPLSRDKLGQADKPDFDFTNIGLLFPQNDATEIVYIITQMSHSMKAGGHLRPHVHFVQDEAEFPVFKMAYRWYDNGGDPSAAFTILTATSFAFPYVSGSILQIAMFPEIDGSVITGSSSMLDIKLYRDDNVVTGDVLAKEFDMHYQIDSVGSGREYMK